MSASAQVMNQPRVFEFSGLRFAATVAVNSWKEQVSNMLFTSDFSGVISMLVLCGAW
jgi:hypothetical protein